MPPLLLGGKVGTVRIAFSDPHTAAFDMGLEKGYNRGNMERGETMACKTKLLLPHRKGKLLLFLLLSLGMVAFIFTRSLQPGEASEAESGFFVWLLQLLGLGGTDAGLLEHLVRKTAHFVEYACLGGVLACFWRTVLLRHGTAGLLAGITAAAVAAVDETIQHWVPGRTGQCSDVLLDTAGAVTGLVLVLLALWLWSRHGQKQA